MIIWGENVDGGARKRLLHYATPGLYHLLFVVDRAYAMGTAIGEVYFATPLPSPTGL